MKNKISNSTIIRGIMKGILVPILTTTILLTTITIPTFAATGGSKYLPGEKEALGIKQLEDRYIGGPGTDKWDVTKQGTYDNPIRSSSFIVGVVCSW